MLKHTEVGIEIDTDVAGGQHSQLLFDDELSVPLNCQREVNFITFWPKSQVDNTLEFPIWVQICSVAREPTVLYRAPLETVLSVAIPIVQTKIHLQIFWDSKASMTRACHVTFSIGMEVDVRRKCQSFSHINRNPEPPDPYTLTPGTTQIVNKI
jgi:hypothetical protein